MDKLLIFCFIVLTILFSINGYESKGAKEVGTYELKRGDFSLKFTNYGATMLSVILPDKYGKLADVALGFESLNDYKNDTTYFGAIVGRVANRIGGAKFKLNGVEYKLIANDGRNMLHGGSTGFSDVIWTVHSYKKHSHITFTYDSFDREQGFPGNVTISVTYKLVGTNKLLVKMKAKPLNKPTPINLALHTYWNLRGHNSGDILNHNLQLFATQYTPVDDELIPTGKILPVNDTPYDFLEPHEIGSMIDQLPNGYDINYVLDVDNDHNKHLKRAALVHDKFLGRKMELWTNQHGLQVYTSNMLKDVKGKSGFVYEKFAGVCLETQGFPDSVNHPNFPSQIVNPGEIYRHTMVYRLTAS